MAGKCPSAALPFGIRDAEGRLLLARGQRITSEEQFETLLERGALVDLADLQPDPNDPRHAPREALHGLWGDAVNRMGRTLCASALQRAEFLQALDTAAAPVLALIERDPDLALFQVLRQPTGSDTQYGVRRSVHSATAAFLGARRLGASNDEAQRAVRAALTMNLSMLELQSQLATQVDPPLPKQRELIDNHPERSRLMLEEQGVQDEEWLQAVAHHAAPAAMAGGPSSLTVLIHTAEVFTATFSARKARSALASDRAARHFFLGRQGQPEAAALLKEFGLYPPGTCVRLASGESGVVVRRGAVAHAPIVACVLNRSGDPLVDPQRRDCAQPAFAVVAVLQPESLRVRIAPERLLMVA